MKLFLVGKYPETWDDFWEFVGIYDEFRRALEACTSAYHFIVPVTLNQTAPESSEFFPDCFYPLRGDETSNPLPAWFKGLEKGGLLSDA